ncbi:MAG: S-methyl-5-thioribose-1-phosphate isomerase, partial [Planctomycetes bacterium]|nr:S-methyl-5-thioribose-1-phosphate isomerase [Planctomycetota bacterium]
MADYTTLRWQGDARTGRLFLLDQTRLPTDVVELECSSVEAVWQAIRELKVRGAPAIGVAAAYGVVLGLQEASEWSRESFDRRFKEVLERLASS